MKQRNLEYYRTLTSDKEIRPELSLSILLKAVLIFLSESLKNITECARENENECERDINI